MPDRIGVAVIGTGWIGEIRAHNCARHPLVEDLFLAEIDTAKAEKVAANTGARLWTTDYRELLRRDDVHAVIVSTTPESTHYPIARDALLAGKHVLLEKPMALTLREADELVEIARSQRLKFTIGYTQRFNPKYAFVKECIVSGRIGRPVTALVSRSAPLGLGQKLATRSGLTPTQMEATHDLDFVLWCLQDARPVRVYAQSAYKVMRGMGVNAPDCVWTIVTMDDGTVLTVGANWILPPTHPRAIIATIEFWGTEGSLIIDDTHREVLFYQPDGLSIPMSTMPGEQIMHVFQGPMQAETWHFIDCVVHDRAVLVTPEQARRVMEVTLAADLSAEIGKPVELPMEYA